MSENSLTVALARAIEKSCIERTLTQTLRGTHVFLQNTLHKIDETLMNSFKP